MLSALKFLRFYLKIQVHKLNTVLNNLNITGNCGANPTKELSAPQCPGRALWSGGTHADARVRGRYGVVQQDWSRLVLHCSSPSCVHWCTGTHFFYYHKQFKSAYSKLFCTPKIWWKQNISSNLKIKWKPQLRILNFNVFFFDLFTDFELIVDYGKAATDNDYGKKGVF